MISTEPIPQAAPKQETPPPPIPNLKQGQESAHKSTQQVQSRLDNLQMNATPEDKLRALAGQKPESQTKEEAQGKNEFSGMWTMRDLAEMQADARVAESLNTSALISSPAYQEQIQLYLKIQRDYDVAINLSADEIAQHQAKLAQEYTATPQILFLENIIVKELFNNKGILPPELANDPYVKARTEYIAGLPNTHPLKQHEQEIMDRIESGDNPAGHFIKLAWAIDPANAGQREELKKAYGIFVKELNLLDKLGRKEDKFAEMAMVLTLISPRLPVIGNILFGTGTYIPPTEKHPQSTDLTQEQPDTLSHPSGDVSVGT